MTGRVSVFPTNPSGDVSPSPISCNSTPLYLPPGEGYEGLTDTGTRSVSRKESELNGKTFYTQV